MRVISAPLLFGGHSETRVRKRASVCVCGLHRPRTADPSSPTAAAPTADKIQLTVDISMGEPTAGIEPDAAGHQPPTAPVVVAAVEPREHFVSSILSIIS